jgi:hypothetical protein
MLPVSLSNIREPGNPRLTLATLFGAAILVCMVIPQEVWKNLPDLCLFHRCFGRPCPTCGLTRSWGALLHGEVATAFRYHLLGPWLLALLIGILALSFLKGRFWLPARGWVWCVAVVWASYAVARMVGWLPPPPPNSFLKQDPRIYRNPES